MLSINTIITLGSGEPHKFEITSKRRILSSSSLRGSATNVRLLSSVSDFIVLSVTRASIYNNINQRNVSDSNNASSLVMTSNPIRILYKVKNDTITW